MYYMMKYYTCEAHYFLKMYLSGNRSSDPSHSESEEKVRCWSWLKWYDYGITLRPRPINTAKSTTY